MLTNSGCGCFITDFKRMVQGRIALAGVAGVALTFAFAVEYEGYSIYQSVFQLFIAGYQHAGNILTFVFCMFPFALALSEDMERYYCRYAIIRTGIMRYVFSKTFVTYFSAILCMLAGGGLFIGLSLLRYPWSIPDDAGSMVGIFGMTVFGQYLTGGNYLAFCLGYLFMKGLLAGMLAVAASYCSLFIRNKAMAVALPVCLVQIAEQFQRIPWINVNMFYPMYGVFFDYPYLAVWYPVFFSVAVTVMLSLAIVRKIRHSL